MKIEKQNSRSMHLKFNLKNGHASVAIITVDIDEESSKMKSFQATNPDIEMQLKKGGNFARLRDLVQSVASGTICSDRLEIKNYGRSILYDMEQMSS